MVSPVPPRLTIPRTLLTDQPLTVTAGCLGIRDACSRPGPWETVVPILLVLGLRSSRFEPGVQPQEAEWTPSWAPSCQCAEASGIWGDRTASLDT